jgi:hypothetical protein
MSKQQELRCYPTVCRYAEIDGQTIDTVQRASICIILLQIADEELNTVFAIGESLCHDHDNFWKTRGIGIARGRALKAGDCDYSAIFSLAEALSFDENGNCLVRTPMTEMPIPVGMVKRLGDLMENGISQPVYSSWRTQMEERHSDIEMALDLEEMANNQHIQNI